VEAEAAFFLVALPLPQNPAASASMVCWLFN